MIVYSEPCITDGLRYVGTLIEKGALMGITSAKKCQKECFNAQSRGCKYFTYGNFIKGCYLFSDKGTAIKNQSKWKSGPAFCPGK